MTYLLSYANGVVTSLNATNLKDAKREAEQRVTACQSFANGYAANVVERDTYKVVAEVAWMNGAVIAYEPIPKAA